MRRLARVFVLACVGAFGAGCTTVKVAQRDGCWVRETKRTLRGTLQDVGPCVRPPPSWSEDRLTRLVQECVAQADYRWQVRALAAWNRREPLPAQDTQETVIKTCMNEAATGVVTQNETLAQRLAEISGDREAFRAEATQGNQHLRASADRLADYLGEAAKRPPPVATATATATSDGTATTENGLTADTASSGGPPAASVAVPAPVVPAAAAPPAPAAAKPDPARAAPEAAPDAAARAAKAKRALAARAARRRALARAAPRGCEIPAPARDGGAREAVVCPAPAPAVTPEAGGAR
ncbi:MAG TPA: hypothetical protein VFL83_00330 [Anaeromyxobacter sp.]|nr:hypothetical protein [Anaeromyxobacter sp.]